MASVKHIPIQGLLSSAWEKTLQDMVSLTLWTATMVLSTLVLSSSLLLLAMVSSIWPLYPLCTVQWSGWEVGTDGEEMHWIRRCRLSSPDLKNTPRDEQMESPMQRLMRRRVNTLLPISDGLRKPTRSNQKQFHQSRWSTVKSRSITMVAEQRGVPKVNWVTLDLCIWVQRLENRRSS